MSNATRIKCQWENGIQRFYVDSTDETVQAMAPVWFKDDFIGHQQGIGSLGNTADLWEVVDEASASEALVADTQNGIFSLALAAGSDEAEDAVLYFGDQTVINVLNDVQFETRLAVQVAPGTGVRAVWGMCGDHNLDKDTVAESAWFSLDAGLDLCVECDDATANTLDDQDTGTDLVAEAFHIYRIDFSDLSDVKYFVDGSRVLTDTTFDMSGLDGTTGLFQPYFSLDKATGAVGGTLYIDYVSFWGTRSSLVSNS